MAPSSRKAEATARPNPPVPPATRTTRPSNLALIATPPARHVTLRFVRGVSRRGRSIQFEGWLQGRHRCSHGSTHRIESSRANGDRSEKLPFHRRRGGGRCDRVKKCGPDGERFPRLSARGRIPGSNVWGTRL